MRLSMFMLSLEVNQLTVKRETYEFFSIFTKNNTEDEE